VPMHKSNYVLITDMTLLTGVNNKGGLVKWKMLSELCFWV
jgi:hypothetical protein